VEPKQEVFPGLSLDHCGNCIKKEIVTLVTSVLSNRDNHFAKTKKTGQNDKILKRM
jgi:hypothetical protein